MQHEVSGDHSHEQVSHSFDVRACARFGSDGFGSVALGSVRFGSVRFGSVQPETAKIEFFA